MTAALDSTALDSTALKELADGTVPWPPQDVARYRREGIWGTATIPQEFAAVAASRGSAEAVVTLTETLSYQELDERSERLAAALIEIGFERGERVLLQVDNRAATAVLWYGLLKAALVPVATLTLHRRHEIGAIAELTRATGHAVIADDPKFDHVAFAHEMAAENPRTRIIVTLGEAGSAQTRSPVPPATSHHRLEDLTQRVGLERARALVAERQVLVDPDDVAVFQLSGGTTGTPKVIPRLHAEYWSNAVGYARRLGWTPDVRVAHVMPVIHNAGIVCALHAGHSVGGAVALGTVRDALQLVSHARATDVILAPFVTALQEDPAWDRAVGSLQRVILSGAKFSEPVLDDFAVRGIHVAELFGMGEGPFTLTELDDPASIRARTVGRPLLPADVLEILVPGTEDPVADGEIGELCFRGSSTVRGYYEAGEHNTRAFTSASSLRTGDLACWVTLDGVRGLSIEGRLKDLINRGGEKVNAEEVETLLRRHPQILAAAVVPMPDPRLGERACAYLVTTGGQLTVEDVGRHLKALGVATYKWPERLEHVDRFPTTAVGKISKVTMRKDVEAKLLAESDASGAGAR